SGARLVAISRVELDMARIAAHAQGVGIAQDVDTGDLLRPQIELLDQREDSTDGRMGVLTDRVRLEADVAAFEADPESIGQPGDVVVVSLEGVEVTGAAFERLECEVDPFARQNGRGYRRLNDEAEVHLIRSVVDGVAKRPGGAGESEAERS